MIGAHDYYRAARLPALQLVPSEASWTVDVPDLSRPWSAEGEPVWRWLHERWTWPVSEGSVAVTDLDALRGRPVTEAIRWEDTHWELFAGVGREIPIGELREVPLGTLLASQPDLEAVLGLEVGTGLRREPGGRAWRPWT